MPKKNIISPNERFDFSICNPPFHSSASEAHSKASRKLNNLNKSSSKRLKLNFGGQSNELWCKGGERQFILQMIKESKLYSTNVFWFTTLISSISIRALKR